MRIRNRMADFVAETGIKSGIIPTMITTFGVRLTQYAALAQVQITMDDLFVLYFPEKGCHLGTNRSDNET